MSELKAYLCIQAREIENKTFSCYNQTLAVKNAPEATMEQVYLKSDADKIIGRHKYKRCLAMAEMCRARYDEEYAQVNGYGTSWEYISKEMKYWEKWHERWLELAEKFKEAK